MKAALIKVAVAATSLAIVAYLVVLDLPKATPGPLTPVHARLPELQGLDGCAVCHGGDGRSLAEACLDCHAPIAQDIELGTGLHGAPLDQPVAQCGACHVEHHGDALPLTGELAFTRAGVAGPAGFDHALVGYLLEGVHTSQACDACHRSVDHAWIPDGLQRFGGLDRNCAGCHEDPHEAPMLRGCADCHGQSLPFAELDGFVHAAEHPLIGGHAGLRCADCHTGSYAVEAVAGVSPPVSRTCADCHEDPHSQAFLEHEDAPEGASCANCHGLDAWLPAELTDVQHSRSGFPLEEPHDTVACADCHAPSAAFAARFPGRRQDECASCHSDPHGGQFAGGPLSSCIDCHGRTSFADCTFGVEEHALTPFPLTGAHATTDCQACHGATLTEFRGLTSTCADCHGDAHRGALEGSCDQCHGTTAFRDVLSSFDHQGATGFALAGAHGAASCESCHPRSAMADRHGRTLGFVAEHSPGDTGRCATCHDDVHQGTFGAQDCADCHGFEHFAPAREFDHAAAGFPLEGAHAQTACATCHPADADAPRGFAHASSHFGGTTCAACHEDAHRPTLGTDCASCHDTLTFRAVTRGFDHERDTRFALVGVHSAISCAECHPPQLQGARSFGHAQGTSCADCHADPHAGQFREARGATDCAACHGTGGPWSSVTFDHAASAFPLDETHAALACAACHQPSSLRSGREVVRYKPIAHSCADCHGKNFAGPR